MKIEIPELALVVLIGASGSGKSTFGRKHFLPSEVISSDYCRLLVADDENDLDATTDAFDLLHYLAGKRLKRGKLTVIDATNVQPGSRQSLIKLAKDYHVIPVAIVLDLDEKICQARNAERSDRDLAPHVIRNQRIQLKKSLKKLKKEGFRYIFKLDSPGKVEEVSLARKVLWNNFKHETGPFDIIGDVHGCFDELKELLEKLGYQIKIQDDRELNDGYQVTAPEGRKAVFVGDLVDRGPKVTECLRLAMSMVETGNALCVPGNHEAKLKKALQGKDVKRNHGLAESMEQLETESETFREKVVSFIDGMVSHFVLDGGKLVVAHAGMREDMQGRASAAVRAFALYGETTGEIDEFGLPVRHNWAMEYKGEAMVVFGHTPVPEALWVNRTIDIDTGCVFGGKLTALRYPEKEIVSVPAKMVYCEPTRPLISEKARHFEEDFLPDLSDVLGKQLITTRLRGNLTILEENGIAALEVLSRFSIDPRWLIYLPPTMSPSETSKLDGYLEFPDKAFEYYQKEGVKQVICEEKHMGSRAVVVLCRDGETARTRFGVGSGKLGACYTRTGRAFFTEENLENAFLEKVSQALGNSDFWNRFQTNWVCLDCELMPWSAKAQALLKEQYAAVGAAAEMSFEAVQQALAEGIRNGLPLLELQTEMQEKAHLVEKYREAYRQYCWPVTSLEDYKLAPFHILATEGQVHTDKNHVWHMEEIARICAADPGFLLQTRYQVINLEEEDSIQQGIDWWIELTSKGGEGMVVKPLDFIVNGSRGMVQPAIKCRGPEYLRIIYGPEYSLPANLNRLRNRGLNAKRSLALREFALGIEALERFVGQDAFRRVHQCVFGVLALESEPVDPRL
ncbi:MAG: polynucleotide kinase-phosphatase [Bacteroidia bacterium]|nr:polynucleotide kinase-phosphatase [Bacteroidia bacterium]